MSDRRRQPPQVFDGRRINASGHGMGTALEEVIAETPKLAGSKTGG